MAHDEREERLALVARYATVKTEREKAEIEQALWNTATASDRRRLSTDGHSHTRARWLVEQLGSHVGQFEPKSRHTLLLAGGDAAALWDRVDREKMPALTACSILRNGRETAVRKCMELTDAIAAELAEYDKGTVMFTAQGKMVRKRSHAQNRVKRIAGTAPPKPQSKRVAPQEPTWADVREIVARKLAPLLVDMDAHDAEQEIHALDTDLKQVFDQHLARLRRAAERRSVGAVAVSRQKVIRACQTLVMPPLKYGHPPDMRRAQSQKNKLCKLYHPDKSGTEETRPRFQEVVEAYATLEDYASQFSADIH